MSEKYLYGLLSVFNAPINQHTIECTTIIQQRYQTLYKHFFLFNQSIVIANTVYANPAMAVTSSVTQTCLPFRTLILVSKDTQIHATVSPVIQTPCNTDTSIYYNSFGFAVRIQV